MFAWAITIGAHSRIAHDVRIIVHDAAVKHLTGYTEVRPVEIGESCYIGAGALILPGATIGAGSIIGAGAVVRGDIPRGVVATGNPAKAVKHVTELRERHVTLQSAVTLFDKRPSDGLTELEERAMRAVLARDGRLYVR
jgi:acetyltransferase-like isoleucine patch superfamily enzyme